MALVLAPRAGAGPVRVGGARGIDVPSPKGDFYRSLSVYRINKER